MISIACDMLYLACIYDINIHFRSLYPWKANCIDNMQLHAIKMNPFCIMTHVYGFDQLFHDTW
jgi:hypothetical protein